MAEKRDPISFSLPALLLAVAIAGGVVWRREPLSKPRPDNISHIEQETNGRKLITARLWEDPLSAIDREFNSYKDQGAKISEGVDTLESLRVKIEERAQADSKVVAPGGQNEQVTVLIAMVSGGPYAEDVEMRIREREAVLSALASAGYREEYEDQIGALSITWNKDQSSENKPRELMAVSLKNTDNGVRTSSVMEIEKPNAAYEWWQQSAPDTTKNAVANNVLVIWLSQKEIQQDPLSKLALLAKRLGHSQYQDGKIVVRILGPKDSSSLRDIVSNLPRLTEKTAHSSQDELFVRRKKALDDLALMKPRLLENVEMYSWSCTAMDELLLTGSQAESPRSFLSDRMEAEWGLHFVNTIATDEQLCAELIGELRMRGVDINDQNDHIALLFESDTFYGSTLPVAFAEELLLQNIYRKQLATMDKSGRYLPLEPLGTKSYQKSLIQTLTTHNGKMNTAEWIKELPNLHLFTYFRGVDGKLPNETFSTDEKNRPRASQSGNEQDRVINDQDEMDRAEGRNQLDYIPRIGDRLEQLQRKLAHKHDGITLAPEVRAIGVLGSDFYDKFMILQALRSRFPRVIFFTTDLDARFLDPKFQQFTRNVIVASSFGLSLNEKLQGSTPPFRDCYQTSLYLATILAIEGRPRKALNGESGASKNNSDPLQTQQSPIARGKDGTLKRTPKIAVSQHTIPFIKWRDLLQNKVAPVRRFEIGRYNAVDLSVPYHGIDVSQSASIQPENVRRRFGPRRLFWASVSVLCVGVLLLRFSNSLRLVYSISQRNRRKKELLLYSPDQIRDLQGVRNAIPRQFLFGTGFPLRDSEIASDLNRALVAGAPLAVVWPGVSVRVLRKMIGLKSGIITRTLGRLLPGSTMIGRKIAFGGAWNSVKHVYPFCQVYKWDAYTGEIAALAKTRLSYDKFLGNKVFQSYARSMLLTSYLRNVWITTMAVGLCVVIFVAIVFRQHLSVYSQPFSIAEGVSIWPSTCLRFLALLCSIVLLAKSSFDLRENAFKISEKFRLKETSYVHAQWCKAYLKAYLPFSHSSLLLRRLFRVFLNKKLYDAVGWHEDSELATVDAAKLWDKYLWLGSGLCRSFRILRPLIIYTAFGWATVFAFGETAFRSYRGEFSNTFDAWINVVAYIGFTMLNFYVVDASRLCRRFILNLGDKPTTWPEATLKKVSIELGGADAVDLDELLDIRVIAARTKAVAPLIYYPFLIISLFIVARSEIFNQVDWPFWLFLLYACNLCWCVYSAILLQSAAATAKRTAVAQVHQKLREIRGKGGQVTREVQLEAIIAEIEEVREGAFTKYLEVPWVRAILIPFSGSGAIALLEFLTRR